MTVAELIEELKKQSEDFEVVVQYRDAGGDYVGVDSEIRLNVDYNEKRVIL